MTRWFISGRWEQKNAANLSKITENDGGKLHASHGFLELGAIQISPYVLAQVGAWYLYTAELELGYASSTSAMLRKLMMR